MTDNIPEMDKDEYEIWLDEVDKKEIEESQTNWEQYCQEMNLDSEGWKRNYGLRRHKKCPL
jgi:hypothetical protein